MSVANFDGDGTGDTTGLVYGFEHSTTGETEIRKVIRLGYGEIGSSPGDVRPMSSTKSTLDDQLPAPPLPFEFDNARDECGEDIPAWACEDCGAPVYLGSTCNSPGCGRCWPAAVRDLTIRQVAKIDGLRRWGRLTDL